MAIDNNIELIKRMSRTLCITVGVLAVIGVLFVRSACLIWASEPGVLWLRQCAWIALGVVGAVAAVVVDYRRICREAWWIYGVSIFLLILVLIVGDTAGRGAKRWLYLFGAIGFQPSEFAKLAVIVLLAHLLSRPHVDAIGPKSVLLVLLVLGIPVVLVVFEPDIGTALVLLPVAFAMMLTAGVRARILIALVSLGLLVMVLGLGILFLPEKLGFSEKTQEKIIRSSVFLKPYHKHRIASFLDPGKDPLGRGWSKMQSEIAIGSGGVWGKGYQQGTANLLGFLPRTVAPTDFIFSVIAEETGFAGSVIVIFLFGVVIAATVRIAAGSGDMLGRLLCTGVATMLFFHVFVNISMTIGLLPIVGLPLPLMSSGGSFMISTLVCIGIVQSVQVRRRIVEY